jgi:hypothetical protein
MTEDIGLTDTREHNFSVCNCNTCNPTRAPQAAPDLCSCVEDGFRASLERWQESCPCCFSEAYPNGIQGAVSLAKQS